MAGSSSFGQFSDAPESGILRPAEGDIIGVLEARGPGRSGRTGPGAGRENITVAGVSDEAIGAWDAGEPSMLGAEMRPRNTRRGFTGAGRTRHIPRLEDTFVNFGLILD
ncbi:hypothetical protein MKK58_23815 [Methylobacterium sp. J-078]|nr:hypothetical protein [Methylobacterium sp. J-078]